MESTISNTPAYEIIVKHIFETFGITPEVKTISFKDLKKICENSATAKSIKELLTKKGWVIQTEPTTPIIINNGDFVLFFRGIGTFDCVVTSTTEKAVKVDYENSPTMSGHSGSVTVYTRTAWIPKKALKKHDLIFTVHSWFSFDKSFPIKKYILKNGVKVFI